MNDHTCSCLQPRRFKRSKSGRPYARRRIRSSAARARRSTCSCLRTALRCLAVQCCISRRVRRHFLSPIARGNIARELFLDPSRRRLFPQWESVALGLLKNLRLSAGRHVGDPAFTDFIASLRRESIFSANGGTGTTSSTSWTERRRSIIRSWATSGSITPHLRSMTNPSSGSSSTPRGPQARANES